MTVSRTDGHRSWSANFAEDERLSLILKEEAEKEGLTLGRNLVRRRQVGF